MTEPTGRHVRPATPSWLKAVYATLATLIVVVLLSLTLAHNSCAATSYSSKYVAKQNARCDMGNQKACHWLSVRGLRTQ